MSILCGTADISERYLTAIREAASAYVSGIFRHLREHEYDPELMRLFVVGGGGCMIKHFGRYDPDRVLIIDDICATASSALAWLGRGFAASGKPRIASGTSSPHAIRFAGFAWGPRHLRCGGGQ